MSSDNTPTWTSNNNEDPSSSSAVDDIALNNAEGVDSSSSPGRPARTFFHWRSIVFYTVSILLFALFIYAAVVQNNDSDVVVWYFFYALHAVLPATVILHCVFPAKITYVLSAVMVIYSLVLIIISAVNLGGVKEGEQTQNGQSSLQEELAFELGGACLGLISAVYHGGVVKCMQQRKAAEDAAVPDIENAK